MGFCGTGRTPGTGWAVAGEPTYAAAVVGVDGTGTTTPSPAASAGDAAASTTRADAASRSR